MSNYIYLAVLAIGTILLLTFAASGFIATQNLATQRCMERIQLGYDYMQRKLCDPTKADACHIDHADQIDLDKWLVQELVACNK